MRICDRRDRSAAAQRAPPWRALWLQANSGSLGHEESLAMAEYRRVEIREVGDVTVVRFRDHKIIEDISIQELGQELFQLVEKDQRKKLLLNFTGVDFLSSAALGKLITLDKKMKAAQGILKFCSIRPEIYEVFAITKLNRLFDIKDEEAGALAAF
jgi:anti-sigma B factor antagonist